MNNKQLICMCNLVSEHEIRSALIKGARATSDIQKMTGAGTNCGKCLVVVDAIVEEYLAKRSFDPQKRINFEG